MIIANMQVATVQSWMPRLAAFAVALLLGASGVYWVLRWPVPDAGPRLPLAGARDELPLADAAALARLLGDGKAVDGPAAVAAAPQAASRFRLTGIIAAASGQGLALLSIDGKPPKPYPVGAQLEPGWMLQSVEARRIALATDAKAPVGLRLELPAQQP
jgi:general secretion pathway protein C